MNSPDISLSRRFEAIPPSLIAYAAFALLVTLTDFVFLLFASVQIKEGLIPYTGWNLSGTYPMTLIFVFVMIFQEQRRRFTRMFGMILPLLITIIFGVYGIFQYGEPNYNNPYLTVSPLRPIWTMLIPAVWIVVLYLPNLNRFCDIQTKNEEA